MARVLQLSLVLAVLLGGGMSAAEPRQVSVEALAAWYGDRLELGQDAGRAKRILEAEVLVDALHRAGGETQGLKARLLALQLSPRELRAVVRHGWRPGFEESKRGVIAAEAPLAIDAAKRVKMTVRIPASYTTDRAWPTIISLHGTNGTGPGYLPHWEVGTGAAKVDRYLILAPSADPTYGWGPSRVGRDQVWSALRWLEQHYRVDPDRVYMEGMSMGGAGAKRLATLWPDRLAAIVPRSGPPLPPQYAACYRNLCHLGVRTLSGDQDRLIGVEHFVRERDDLKREGVSAEVNIFPGRGHEIFQELNEDVLDFFAGHSRVRVPERFRFVSLEATPEGYRHYALEIVEVAKAGNEAVDDYVLDNSTNSRALIREMQAARDYAAMQALQKKARDQGLFVEQRNLWLKPLEIDARLDRTSNALVIERTAFISQLKVYLDDDLLDLDRPISIQVRGRTIVQKKVERSPAFLIDELIRTGRRDVTCWAALTVPVR